MDVSLSPEQTAVRERYAELVSDELVPSIRRMAEAPRSSSDQSANGQGVIGEGANGQGVIGQGADGQGAGHPDDGHPDEGYPDEGDPGDLAEVRAAVWQALTGLGATRALLPEPYCGADRLGQQGAVIIAELLGTALYQGPLFETMTGAELLARLPDPDGKLLGEIAEGAAVTLAPRESAVDTHARPGPITLSGGST